MKKKGFAVHLVLLPKYEILDYHVSIIEKKLYSTCEKYDIDMKEISIMADHMHMLFTMPESFDKINFAMLHKETFESFMLEFSESVKNSIENIYGDKFAWENGVHLMLLPSSHIPIISSYLRDQENVHSTMTVQDEIEQVFESKSENNPDDSSDDGSDHNRGEGELF